jgi:hypothetical protein
LGKPFIYVGPSQSAIGELVERETVGVTIPHGQAQRLADEILRYRSLDDAEKTRLRNRTLQAARGFSKQNLCGRLADIILESPRGIA